KNSTEAPLALHSRKSLYRHYQNTIWKRGENTMLEMGIKESWLEVNGVYIHCLTAGESGSPVVLLHSAGDSATLSWSDAIKPLSAHHRVFAPDLPGYGLSDKSEHIAHTTDFYVDFVRQMADMLHLDKVSLMGVSMGGGIALSFALRFPERVEKLVLVDPYGIIDAKAWPAWMYQSLHYGIHYLPFISKFTYRSLGANRTIVRLQLMASGIFHHPERLPARLIDQAYQHAQIPEQGKAYVAWLQSEFLLNGPRTYLVDRLHEITMPTLIVTGEKDRVIPLAYVQKAQASMKNSQLYVLKNCGHWAQRERPEEFNQVVGKFLDELD
ncbi:MAG TPA: alpha/beta hydrolase, partial [Ktedonobacteraceae bacterium]